MRGDTPYTTDLLMAKGLRFCIYEYLFMAKGLWLCIYMAISTSRALCLSLWELKVRIASPPRSAIRALLLFYAVGGIMRRVYLIQVEGVARFCLTGRGGGKQGGNRMRNPEVWRWFLPHLRGLDVGHPAVVRLGKAVQLGPKPEGFLRSFEYFAGSIPRSRVVDGAPVENRCLLARAL